MPLKKLVFIIVALITFCFGVLYNYFSNHASTLILLCILVFVSFYVIIYFLIEKYLYSKIKLIYKLIHHLKLGKDLKDALGEYVGNDPLMDVEIAVKQWAGEKTKEINALKSQEEFRREFLGNIAHEFKTPLFAIQGYAETLLDDGITDTELVKKFLLKVKKNAERLTVLIKDLDEIAKLESGELRIHFKKFDLGELIKEVTELMEANNDNANIKLLFKNKIEVLADRDKIRQVLINLMDNARKYAKENGSTTINIFELHQQVLIEVTDDGIGIEEKYLARLFERFFRTEQSRSRDIGGSGLGLSIVKHIIEAHQQTIHVRSTLGLGSTFGFTLAKA